MAKNTRTFTDNSTTTFAKMGDSGIPSSVVNMSGQRSPYTQTVPKKTMGRGVSPTGKKVNRKGTMIHEANGPACKIVTTLYKANAAAANDTQRNVKYLPSAMGDRSFRGGSGV